METLDQILNIFDEIKNLSNFAMQIRYFAFENKKFHPPSEANYWNNMKQISFLNLRKLYPFCENVIADTKHILIDVF